MAFMHRRSRSENDKGTLTKAQPVHLADRDCGYEESSDEDDLSCNGQAALPTWFPEAAPWTGGSRISPACYPASPGTISDQSTNGSCIRDCGPASGLNHPSDQVYHGPYYYPIPTFFPHQQYAHPAPMPFPAYGYHPLSFYPIPEEAAGLHWQQHGGEERKPVASPERREGHDIRERRIYLGNLRYTATAEEIRQHLNHHGLGRGVEAIFMARAGGGRNRGFCFVTYDSPDRAREAMEQVGGSEHLGRNLICRPSLPRGMHYDPSPGVRPESQAVPQARKHGHSGKSAVSLHNRPRPHKIPCEGVGAADYVVPPYDETKIFSPKRDWISAGGFVVEVANLPPMPGEGSCLREMELLFKGFDV